eukprot:2159087-Pyramimonas_sp.AAC.1
MTWSKDLGWAPPAAAAAAAPPPAPALGVPDEGAPAPPFGVRGAWSDCSACPSRLTQSVPM